MVKQKDVELNSRVELLKLSVSYCYGQLGLSVAKNALKNCIDLISELSAQNMEENIFIYWFPTLVRQGLPQGLLTSLHVQFKHASGGASRLVS